MTRGFSVIIPTTGRASLLRALSSVRLQRFDGDVEVIVVADMPSDSLGHAMQQELMSLSDKLVFSGGGAGGSRSRNIGVQHATNPFVAFLDDDDEWLPTKLARQAVVLSRDPRVVCATRVRHANPYNGGQSRPIPDQLIRPAQDVASYLFLRRKPSVGRSVMYTSCIALSRELALEIPWREGLARHQDWDWLLRLGATSDTSFVQLPTAEAVIWLNSADSISASTNWEVSLEWIREWQTALSRSTYVDFLVGQSLRYALNARSIDGVARISAEIARARRLPHLGPILIALSGLVPRNLLTRVLVRPGKGVDFERA